ncbi:MAG: hypothetical protein M1825_005638, partial [Sarcosagium campestre]
MQRVYDPARDIFTASDKSGEDNEEPSDDHRDGLRAPSQEQKQASSEMKLGRKTRDAPETRPDADPSPVQQTQSLRPDLKTGSRDVSPSATMSKKRSRSPAPHRDGDTASDDSHVNPAKKKSRIEADETRTESLSRAVTKKTQNGDASSYDSPLPLTSRNLPSFRREKGSDSNKTPKRSSKSPPREKTPVGHPSKLRRRERRSPIRRRSRSPPPSPKRSPSPPPRSPSRKLKRPGGASRLTEEEKKSLRIKQEERAQEQIRAAQAAAATRGVHDVVRQHYNAVPERGRDWRKTDSHIKGLRSFNNWIKSVIIQKFSPNEDYSTAGSGNARWAEGLEGGGLESDGKRKTLLVLDIGCGKGGDLFKWQQSPQPLSLYVGIDAAEVSVQQAQERYKQMTGGGGRGGRDGRAGRNQRTFQGEFFVKDAFGEWLGDIPLINEVGIDGGVGPGGQGAISARWGGGGFDVVSMMFCMHYAFESEAKARGMLRNVAGSLKKGGRFLGVIPNSDVLSDHVVHFHDQQKSKSRSAHEDAANADEKHESDKEEGEAEEVPEWGNKIYKVRFPGKPPEDGVFRPPFGWKYSYFLEEAVEEVPEYVVPWEAFRAY